MSSGLQGLYCLHLVSCAIMLLVDSFDHHKSSYAVNNTGIATASSVTNMQLHIVIHHYYFVVYMRTTCKCDVALNHILYNKTNGIKFNATYLVN